MVCAASLVLYLGCVAVFVATMTRRRRRAQPRMSRAPRVSVLKPLAGDDDELEQNLGSFAGIDYPEMEILLGVADATDPAAKVARRFLADHPKLDARLVLTSGSAAVNPKVAQLVELERHARGEVVVISDSNVRVGKRYLEDLVLHLEDPTVGLVTSVVSGVGEETLGAALENLQLASSTAPAVVASEVLTSRPFTVGKSMAMRRRDLVRFGGFHRVGDVLAEDHALGALFREEGFRLRTDLSPVENRNVSCGVRRTLERHTRWAKMRRAIAPRAFFAEPLGTPLAVATLAALAAPDRIGVALVALAAVVQTSCAALCARTLRGHALPLRFLPLEIFRSYLALACWAAALMSREVVWRGKRYTLGHGSRITPVGKRAKIGRAARA